MPKSFSPKDVQVLEKIREHDGYFKVDKYTLKHRKHDGGWSEPLTREVFERGHAVCVVLFDPDLDKLVFVEQFRPGAFAALSSPWFDEKEQSPWLIECVAGIIDAGQSPENVAKREALEEANCKVTDLIPVMHYLVSPGGTSESMYIYVGRTDASNAQGIHGLDHEGEDLRVLSVATDTAFKWLDEGRFRNSMTIIAMQWFKSNYVKTKATWS